MMDEKYRKSEEQSGQEESIKIAIHFLTKGYKLEDVSKATEIPKAEIIKGLDGLRQEKLNAYLEIFTERCTDEEGSIQLDAKIFWENHLPEEIKAQIDFNSPGVGLVYTTMFAAYIIDALELMMEGDHPMRSILEEYLSTAREKEIRRDIAKKMFAKGFEPELVSEITELPIEELEWVYDRVGRTHL